VAEEILEILREEKKISQTEYERLMNKARAEEERASEAYRMAPRAPTDSKFVSGVKSGYRLGRGFGWESSDGNYFLNIGGRIQTLFTYIDRDAEATKISDESEFRLRRARLYFRGHAYDPKLQYTFELDTAPGNVELLNMEVVYALMPEANLMIGQFKPPQSRQELTSSGSQQLIDRSLANDFFNVGRDRGMQLYGTLLEYLFEYRAGVFNGNGLNSRQTSTDFMYAARVAVNPFGPFPYDEPDFAGTPKLLASLGASTQYNQVGKKDLSRINNDNDALEFLVPNSFRTRMSGMPAKPDINNIDVWTSTADLAMKFMGVAFLGEGYYADVNSPLRHDFGSKILNSTYHAWGYNLQAGYFIVPKRLEMVARYSVIDPEDDVFNFKEREEIRGGFNYYFDQHNLKLQVDFGGVRNDRTTGDDVEDIEARVQLQVIF
jgi:hypothetical protein